nr:hypothetical protein Iba_chr10eCG11810 [Ipomoea batatas]
MRHIEGDNTVLIKVGAGVLSFVYDFSQPREWGTDDGYIEDGPDSGRSEGRPGLVVPPTGGGLGLRWPRREVASGQPRREVASGRPRREVASRRPWFIDSVYLG